MSVCRMHGTHTNQPTITFLVARGKPWSGPYPKVSSACQKSTLTMFSLAKWRMLFGRSTQRTKNAVQFTFWAMLGYAPHPNMEKAFAQRREQVIGDCDQLRTDVDVYNAMN